MSERPPAGVGHIHGTSVHGAWAAAKRAWGVARVRKLDVSDEARRTLLEAIVLPGDWIPETVFIEFYEALFRELMGGDEGKLAAFVDEAIDLGWGRVKRALVSIATPEVLWRRATPLWREEHTTGNLRAALTEAPATSATITLEDHAYADSHVMRRVHAESMRRIVSLTRVSNVKETHGLDTRRARRDLVVRVTWT